LSDGAPLAGNAVLVTRPAGQSAPLAAALAAEGAEAVLFPTIGIEALADLRAFDAALDHLATTRLAVFVSANAVDHAMPAVAARGGFAAGTLVAAIGPGTARSLARLGIPSALRAPDGADSEALLDLPELADVAGTEVTIFAGEGGRTLLRDALGARGAQVRVAPCYRRVVPSIPSAPVEVRLREGTLHAVTITSSEGLRNLQTMLAADVLPRLHGLPHVVPHARIAEATAALGVDDVIVCGAGDAAIVDALCARLGHDVRSRPARHMTP
jgi:uroporphyrinogen-III synthase